MRVLTVQFDVSNLTEDQIESLSIAIEIQGENEDHAAPLMVSEVRDVVIEDDVDYH